NNIDQGDLPHRNKEIGSLVKFRCRQYGDNAGNGLQKDILKTIGHHKPQDKYRQHMHKKTQSGIKKVFEHKWKNAKGNHVNIVLIVFHHHGCGKHHDQDVEKYKGDLVIVLENFIPVPFQKKKQHDQYQC